MAFQHQEQKGADNHSVTCNNHVLAIAACIARNDETSFSDTIVVPATSSTTPSNFYSSSPLPRRHEERTAARMQARRPRSDWDVAAAVADARSYPLPPVFRARSISTIIKKSDGGNNEDRHGNNTTIVNDNHNHNHSHAFKYNGSDIANDQYNGNGINAMDEDELNAKRREAQSKERNRVHARRTRHRKKEQLVALQSKLQRLQATNKSLTQRLEELRVANILFGLSEPNANAYDRDTTIVSLLEEAFEIGGKDIFKKLQRPKRKRVVSDASDMAMSSSVNVNTNTNMASITSTACDVHGIPNCKSTGGASCVFSDSGHGNSNINGNRNGNATLSLEMEIDGKMISIGGEGPSSVDLKTKTLTDKDGLQTKLTDIQVEDIK